MSADTETHYDRPSNGPNFRDDDMVALGVVSEFEKNRSLAAAGLADRSSVKCFPVIVWFETKLKGNGCLDRFSPYRIRLKHTRDTSRHRIGFERGNKERTIRVPPSRPVPQDSPPLFWLSKAKTTPGVKEMERAAARQQLLNGADFVVRPYEPQRKPIQPGLLKRF